MRGKMCQKIDMQSQKALTFWLKNNYCHFWNINHLLYHEDKYLRSFLLLFGENSGLSSVNVTVGYFVFVLMRSGMPLFGCVSK